MFCKNVGLKYLPWIQYDVVALGVFYFAWTAVIISRTVALSVATALENMAGQHVVVRILISAAMYSVWLLGVASILRHLCGIKRETG